MTTQSQNSNIQGEAGTWLQRCFPSEFSTSQLVQQGSHKPQAPRDKQLRYSLSFLFLPSPKPKEAQTNPKQAHGKCWAEIAVKTHYLVLFKGKLICNWLQSGWARIGNDQG